jgi:hypothetical protein
MNDGQWEYCCSCGKKHTFQREQVEQEINCRCGRPIDWLELRVPPPERPVSMSLPERSLWQRIPWRPKALVAAMLGLLIVAFCVVDRSPRNESQPVAAQAVAPEQVPEDPLAAEVQTFVDSYPQLGIGTIWNVARHARWARGERRIVSTWDDSYVFYFEGKTVTSVKMLANSQRPERTIFRR